MIQIGGVFTTVCHKDGGILWAKSIATEVGGASRYFSKVSGQGSM